MGRGDMMYQRLAYAPKAHRARPKTKKSPPLLTGIYIIQTPLSFGEGLGVRLLHRLSRILDLARSRLDDRTIDLAGAHGDAGEADFVQTADRVDIATVFAADEDFELRINRAGVFDERANHLLDGGMDGD